MKKSVYAQLVGVLIGIIFVSNFVTFMTFALTTEHTILSEMDEIMTEITGNIKTLYASGVIPVERIPSLLSIGYFKTTVFSSISTLSEDRTVLKFFSASELEQLEQSDEVRASPEGKRRVYARLPAAVIKLEQPEHSAFLFVYPDMSKMMLNFRGISVRMNIVSLVVGAIMILFAAKYIVRPIKQLSEATKKISRGDFAVRIPEKRRDEIGQLIGSFNTMAKDLQGIEILRNDFVSAISHEFKTPLTSIRGYAKLVGDTPNVVDRKEYAAIIVEETERLSHLASNILLLNSLEHEDVAPQTDVYRLDEQLRKVVLLLENHWSDKQLDLHIDLEQVSYSGNEQLLFQVWLNLLDNAIKFSPQGAKLEVSLTRVGDKVQCTIRDYGRGVPLAQQHRVFEKFYKGDKSRGTAGNGLGLSIAKRIVDMHGGEISLVSEPGQGTTVTVQL